MDTRLEAPRSSALGVLVWILKAASSNSMQLVPQCPSGCFPEDAAVETPPMQELQVGAKYLPSIRLGKRSSTSIFALESQYVPSDALASSTFSPDPCRGYAAPRGTCLSLLKDGRGVTANDRFAMQTLHSGGSLSTCVPAAVSSPICPVVRRAQRLAPGMLKPSFGSRRLMSPL